LSTGRGEKEPMYSSRGIPVVLRSLLDEFALGKKVAFGTWGEIIPSLE